VRRPIEILLIFCIYLEPFVEGKDRLTLRSATVASIGNARVKVTIAKEMRAAAENCILSVVLKGLYIVYFILYVGR